MLTLEEMAAYTSGKLSLIIIFKMLKISSSNFPPRNTTDQELLYDVSQQIRHFYADLNFVPTLSLIATWYRIGHYDFSTERTNTFQVVLITDGSYSFVIFLYSEIQWIQPDLRPPADTSERYRGSCIL